MGVARWRPTVCNGSETPHHDRHLPPGEACPLGRGRRWVIWKRWAWRRWGKAAVASVQLSPSTGPGQENTIRQAGRQANRQANKQADRQVDKQAGKQIGKQTGNQTSKKRGNQTDRQTDKQTDRQTDKQIPEYQLSPIDEGKYTQTTHSTHM